MLYDLIGRLGDRRDYDHQDEHEQANKNVKKQTASSTLILPLAHDDLRQACVSGPIIGSEDDQMLAGLQVIEPEFETLTR